MHYRESGLSHRKKQIFPEYNAIALWADSWQYPFTKYFKATNHNINIVNVGCLKHPGICIILYNIVRITENNPFSPGQRHTFSPSTCQSQIIIMPDTPNHHTLTYGIMSKEIRYDTSAPVG